MSKDEGEQWSLGAVAQDVRNPAAVRIVNPVEMDFDLRREGDALACRHTAQFDPANETVFTPLVMWHSSMAGTKGTASSAFITRPRQICSRLRVISAPGGLAAIVAANAYMAVTFLRAAIMPN